MRDTQPTSPDTEIAQLRTRQQELEQQVAEQEALLKGIHQFQRDLHTIERELSQASTFDDLCKRAVELGRERLGFDRFSIWFAIENYTKIQGSYGVDEQGDLRDERSQVHTLSSDNFIFQRLHKESSLYSTKMPLLDDTRTEVGQGEHLCVSLWNGEAVIGYLSMDNLLSRNPITLFIQEKARLYALSLAHLVTQLRIQEAQAEQATLFHRMFSVARDGISLRTKEDKVLFMNESLKRILRLTQEEFESRQYPPGYRVCNQYGAPFPITQLPSRVCLETGEAQRDVIQQIVHPNGEVTWVSMGAEPIFLAGESSPYAAVTCYTDITAQKVAEMEIKNREELYRKAIRTMGSIVYQYDFRKEAYTFMDANIGELLGYHAEEVTPQLLASLSFAPEIQGEMKGLTTLEASQLFRSGKVEMWQSDESYITKSGKLRYFADNSVSLKDEQGEVWGCLGILQDITERKSAEIALRESEERFRQMAENVREIFWVFDVFQFKLLYVSPSYSEVWGIPREALYEDPLLYLQAIHPEDIPQIMERQQRELAGEETDTVYRIIRPNGEIRWLHHRAYPITNAAGTLYRVIGIAVDITHQKELEQQVLQAQKMQGIGRIAGGIAHDFNNILTAILGYVEMAEMVAPPDTSLTRYLSNIRVSSERAAKLTSQLLTFARRKIVAPKVVDVDSVIEETMEIITPILGDSTTFVFQNRAVISTIRTDPTQIQQVILNLAINAKDAMPQGGTLTIETSNITHNHHSLPDISPGNYLVIRVSDTGTGIDEANRQHIFEPFFTTKSQGKGTGLGLSTCYGIVQQHQGHISFESKVGVGTTFTVYLPTTQEALPQKETESSQKDYRGTETILLAEDETFVRDIASQTLEAHGYRVLSADNGSTAIQLLKQISEPIHLLLTDVVMPQTNGLELANYVKETHPTIKILYMSGHTDSQALEKQIVANVAKFLPKPFNRTELLSHVREALNS